MRTSPEMMLDASQREPRSSGRVTVSPPRSTSPLEQAIELDSARDKEPARMMLRLNMRFSLCRSMSGPRRSVGGGLTRRGRERARVAHAIAVYRAGTVAQEELRATLRLGRRERAFCHDARRAALF